MSSGSSSSRRPAAKPATQRAKKASREFTRVDLKADSPKIREMEKAEMQRRGFKWGIGIICTICLLALLKITVREAFLKNPQFTLRQVVVKTEGPATAEQIVRVSAITQGMNLLTANLREIQRRILEMPQVKSVKISRDYHGRMTLAVDQRHPVAWIACARLGMRAGTPETGYFLDAEGTLFPCEVVTETYAKLPVIQHEALNQNQPGKKITDLSVTAALSLLEKLQKRQETAAMPSVREIATQYSWGLNITFDDGARVFFGIDDLDDQLARLDRITLEAKHRGWKIDTLNVLVRENIPITFREAPDLEGLQDALTASTSPPAASSRITPRR